MRSRIDFFSDKSVLFFLLDSVLSFEILEDATKHEERSNTSYYALGGRAILPISQSGASLMNRSSLENAENNGISFFLKFSNISSVYCSGNKNGVHVDLGMKYATLALALYEGAGAWNFHLRFGDYCNAL